MGCLLMIFPQMENLRKDKNHPLVLGEELDFKSEDIGLPTKITVQEDKYAPFLNFPKTFKHLKEKYGIFLPKPEEKDPFLQRLKEEIVQLLEPHFSLDEALSLDKPFSYNGFDRRREECLLEADRLLEPEKKAREEKERQEQLKREEMIRLMEERREKEKAWEEKERKWKEWRRRGLLYKFFEEPPDLLFSLTISKFWYILRHSPLLVWKGLLTS